ncbi:hypoxanthine phosphoribosyltransferase [candidate division WOR-3 bacterium]|nr:hypoxanthine phosphoribosyltransferase [candidate division WOR-3 bacterium]
MKTIKGMKFETLINEIDIATRVKEMVKKIAEDSKGKEIFVIGILKGSFVFLSDLLRLFYVHNIHPSLDFITVESYGSGKISSGKLKMLRDITTDIENKWVLIVDDILDTGRTLAFAKEYFQKKNPAYIKTCVFLDKPERRVNEFKADYVGFEIPDKFVVGYGMDYDNLFRELPYVAVILDEEK